MDKEIKERIAAINSGVIPEGYKKTKVGIVPVEWEECHFKKMFSRLKRKNTENNTNVLTISAQYGLINQEEFFNKSVASDDKSNYYLLYKGDFAYNKSYSNGYPFGAIKALEKYEKGVVSPLYICFSPTEKNECPDYYLQYFESGNMNREIQAIAQEGARNHGLLNIGIDDFFNSYLVAPPLSEQQKIAEILSTQDKLIELQEKKIEQLKELKKAYLQKMFPKKGSKYPELRFKGFTEPWEQRKLGELANVKDSARISNDLWSDSGVPYIRASDLSNNDLSGVLFLSEETYSFYKNQTGAPILGDLLFNGGGEIGKAVLKRDDKPIYVQGGAVLYVQTSSATELVGEYLESYFQSPLAKKYIDIASAGGTIKHFTLGPSQEMPIIYPSLDEQRKIGDYFSKLDYLITLHQRKSEQEKQKKKALMQLLLTGIVRTK